MISRSLHSSSLEMLSHVKTSFLKVYLCVVYSFSCRRRFLFKLKKTYNNIFSIYYRLSEFRPYNRFFNRDREKTVKLLPSSSKSVYQIVALALEEGRRSEMWIYTMLCLEIRIMKSWCASQSDSSLSHYLVQLGAGTSCNS